MKTNKIIALFVLALLVFSVPIFAQDEAGTTDTAAETGDASTVQSGESVGGGSIHNKLQTIKNRGGDATNRINTYKNSLQGDVAEVQACEDSTTEACQTTRAQYIEHYSQYIKAVRDKMVANFDMFDELANRYIEDPAQLAQVLNHIKDKRDTLKALMSELDEVNTIEEAKAFKIKLKDWYAPIPGAIQSWKAETNREALHSVYTRMANLNTKVNRVMSFLENRGANLGTEYPAKVAAINEALTSAQEELDLARGLVNQIRDTTNDADKAQLAAQAKSYEAEAIKNLRDARSQLHDLIQAIKANAGNQEFAQAVAQA
ncbi:MAG: hypothetical protein V1663_03940 [archaeon]